MRIQMIGSQTGMRDGVPAPKRGDVLDVPDAEAATLIAQGMAEAAPAPAAAPVEAETADAAPEGEKAVAAPRKTRARKATG